MLDLDNSQGLGCGLGQYGGAAGLWQAGEVRTWRVLANWHILFTEALHCPPGIAPGTPVLTVTPGGGAAPELPACSKSSD